jgi:hypothetical protein
MSKSDIDIVNSKSLKNLNIVIKNINVSMIEEIIQN